MYEYALNVLWPDLAGAIFEEFSVLALWGEGFGGCVARGRHCGTRNGEGGQRRGGGIIYGSDGEG